VGVSEAGISLFLIRLGTAEPLAQAGALILRGYSATILVLGILHIGVWKGLRRSGATDGRPE